MREAIQEKTEETWKSFLNLWDRNNELQFYAGGKINIAGQTAEIGDNLDHWEVRNAIVKFLIELEQSFDQQQQGGQNPNQKLYDNLQQQNQPNNKNLKDSFEAFANKTRDAYNIYNSQPDAEETFLGAFIIQDDKHKGQLSGLFKALKAVYGDNKIEDNFQKIAESVTWGETFKAFLLTLANYLTLGVAGYVKPQTFTSTRACKNTFSELFKTNQIIDSFSKAVVESYDAYIDEAQDKNKAFFDTLDNKLAVKLDDVTKKNLLNTLHAMYGDSKITDNCANITSSVTWKESFKAFFLTVTNYATLGIAGYVKPETFTSTRACKGTFVETLNAAAREASKQQQPLINV